ncbi:LysR family transcriptional regulator [Candidatus Methylospira mobilis]|uniref:LysR family transcriptional regulator n=1 Tax=Candidatus Methylospira mobilis TaxID=1808979 RepID=A0A5Q0BHB5_9GAMM|nr:LysR substrate-binding domain-containing protein [Candidatus Methylospira mobilis]QFY41567.1 LysR family transcriptional regulator [Candidatus Methylospira mobilis]WNV05192.1 LysR substrate-binding domain-containing protein [Candidatus Methylospira mobilis]
MNLRGTDLNLLTIFEATFEERNQTKTCDRLGMTQSAISNALNRLKQITNDPLFIVRNKGLQPTARAIELYDQVHSALDLVRSGLKDVLDFTPAESTRMFSLAISFGDGTAGLPVLFELIRREAPQVRLNMSAPLSETEATTMLRDHALDAVVHFERYNNPDLRHEIVSRYPVVVIARKDHPRIGETAGKQEIMQEEFVRVAGLHRSPGIVADRDELFQFMARKTAIVVPNVMVQMSVVARSDLLAITSLQSILPFQRAFALKTLPCPWAIDPVPMYQVWHRSADNDAGGTWFRNKLKEAAQSAWPEVKVTASDS